MKLSTMNRVLAAVLALGMTACGNGESSSSGAASSAASSEVSSEAVCRIRCYRGNRCVLRHRGDRRGGRVRLRLPG